VKRAILFLAGANLFIVQFLAVRTIPSILVGTEVILFLVVFCYFLGVSAGYWVSDRLSERGLAVLGWAQLLTHLTLPFSLRFLAAGLMRLDAAGPRLFLLLGLGAFWVSAFYSVLLPRFLAGLAPEEDEEFSRLYGFEILGGIAGCLLIMTVPRLGGGALELLYQALFAVLFAMLLRSTRVLAAAGIACAFYGALFHGLEARSVAAIFNERELPARRVLYAGNTAYQRVEIIEDVRGGRHLYLDGWRHYGSKLLTQFNFFIAGLPTALLDAPELHLVGSGSFEAVRHALDNGARVVSVEIDPVVAEEGRRWLAPEFSDAELHRWSVVIDDAKHHFGTLDRRVDAVAMDIAGPFQRQVALLYTEEFYGLVRSRLRPGGVFSICLNGDLAGGYDVPCRVGRTLTKAFPETLVFLRPEGAESFALAGERLGFGKKEALEALRKAGHGGAVVLDREEALDFMDQACGVNQTIALDGLDIVWKEGMSRLRRSYLR